MFRRSRFEPLEDRRLLAALVGDFNVDGRVDAFDFQVVAQNISQTTAPETDLDANGVVDAFDLQVLAEQWHAVQQGHPAYRSSIDASPAERIGAYFDMAGTAGSIRRLAYNVDEVGWQHVVAEHVAPVADAGVPFAEFHNIWGRDDVSLIMRFPIRGELEADPRLARLFSDFVPTWQQFHDARPDFESIVYVGSPYTHPTMRELEADPNRWWTTAYETLLPLIEAGFTSIGFDASGWDGLWQHELDLELYDVLMHPEARDPVTHAPLIEALGGDAAAGDLGRPMTVYFEALPVNNRRHGMNDRAGELGHDHMIITWQHYREQDPERLDANGEHTAKHPSYIHNGERYAEMREINVIMPNFELSGAEGDSHEEARAKALAKLRTALDESHRNAPASGNIRLLVNPRYLVDLGNQTNYRGHSQSATFSDFLAELDLDAVPTRIVLEPGHVITRPPLHGTLQQSEHDANVFVYTPDAEFSGPVEFHYQSSLAE